MGALCPVCGWRGAACPRASTASRPDRTPYPQFPIRKEVIAEQIGPRPKPNHSPPASATRLSIVAGRRPVRRAQVVSMAAQARSSTSACRRNSSASPMAPVHGRWTITVAFSATSVAPPATSDAADAAIPSTWRQRETDTLAREGDRRGPRHAAPGEPGDAPDLVGAERLGRNAGLRDPEDERPSRLRPVGPDRRRRARPNPSDPSNLRAEFGSRRSLPDNRGVARVIFPFLEDKAADAAALLIELAGGGMEYLRLIKLLYLADRRSLERRGRPIVGDTYVSMDNGPVLSGVYDLVKEQKENPDAERPWMRRIERVGQWEVRARGEPLGALSEADEQVLAAVHEEFQRFDTWKLCDWTHTLPEWKDPRGSSVRIDADVLLKLLGFSDERIRETAEEFAALRAFARAVHAR